jgi:hypothetical protein
MHCSNVCMCLVLIFCGVSYNIVLQMDILSELCINMGHLLLYLKDCLLYYVDQRLIINNSVLIMDMVLCSSNKRSFLACIQNYLHNNIRLQSKK